MAPFRGSFRTKLNVQYTHYMHPYALLITRSTAVAELAR